MNTICANLLTQNAVSEHFNKPIEECWGKPIWEDLPDCPSKHPSTETYLGRLVPITRAIRLLPNGTEMLLANGLEYPSYDSNKKMPFHRETSATEIPSKDGTGRELLGASSDKAIWRELTALNVSGKQNEAGGALSIANMQDDKDYDLWVGALQANKASILDTIESVLKVPANLRTYIGCKVYKDEVLWSEKIMGENLKMAVREYRKQLDGSLSKVDEKELAKKKKFEMEKKLSAIALATATRHYWTAVEKLRPL